MTRLKMFWQVIRYGEWKVGFRRDFRLWIDRTYYDGQITQLSLGWVWIFHRY